MEPRELKVGDVVQIEPKHDDVFGGAFMLVTEPKNWGAQGAVHALKPGSVAYYRCAWAHMEFVGRAPWVLRDEIPSATPAPGAQGEAR